MDKDFKILLEKLLTNECQRAIETGGIRYSEYVGKLTIMEMIEEYKNNKTISSALIQKMTGYESEGILGLKIGFNDIESGLLSTSIKKLKLLIKNNIYGFSSELRRQLNLPTNSFDNLMITTFKKLRHRLLKKNPVMKEIYDFINRVFANEKEAMSNLLKFYNNNISNRFLSEQVFGDIYPRYFKTNILINYLDEKGTQIINNVFLIDNVSNMLNKSFFDENGVEKWLIDTNKSRTINNGYRKENLKSFHRRNYDTYEFSDSSYYMYTVDYHDIPKAIKSLSAYILNTLKKADQLSIEEYIKEIATIRYRFLRIHPFKDGNGRTSRILSNMLSLKKGFAIIFDDKEEDYKAMENAYVAIHNNYEVKGSRDIYLYDLVNNPQNCQTMESEQAIDYLTEYFKKCVFISGKANEKQEEKEIQTSTSKKVELEQLKNSLLANNTNFQREALETRSKKS